MNQTQAGDFDFLIAIGDLRRTFVDVSRNWVQVNFISDGFMRIEGRYSNSTNIRALYHPLGVMEFHTPAEH